jgi:putative transposase
MTEFNSKIANTFHYVTMVAFRRLPVFRNEQAALFFIEALNETREKHPFKLIGYVVMPDHVHLILNPVGCDISLIGKELKGKSARKIIDWLKADNHAVSLEKLTLNFTQKRNHRYAVWQKKVVSIDLWSPKFIQQKLRYLHLNPVRAGLCKHPVDWKWSSYRAYMPGREDEVPVKMDLRGYWMEEDIDAAKSKESV